MVRSLCSRIGPGVNQSAVVARCPNADLCYSPAFTAAPPTPAAAALSRSLTPRRPAANKDASPDNTPASSGPTLYLSVEMDGPIYRIARQNRRDASLRRVPRECRLSGPEIWARCRCRSAFSTSTPRHQSVLVGVSFIRSTVRHTQFTLGSR